MSNQKPTTKMKGVGFNLGNPIEKFMYDEAEEMSGSFAGLMKYLYLNYLIGQGKTPPGMAGNIVINPPPSVQEQPISINQAEQEEDVSGILASNSFSLDD